MQEERTCLNTEMGSSRAQVAALQVQLAHIKQEAEAELQQHMALSEADMACLHEQLLERHVSELESLYAEMEPTLDKQRRHYEQSLAKLHAAHGASATYLQVSLLILTLTCVCCSFEASVHLRYHRCPSSPANSQNIVNALGKGLWLSRFYTVHALGTLSALSLSLVCDRSVTQDNDLWM